MDARRAQRTWMCDLRGPVAEVIWKIAQQPAGQISGEKALLGPFGALSKGPRSARDWHRNKAWMPRQKIKLEEQAKRTTQNKKKKQQHYPPLNYKRYGKSV